ncbi:hypothetical protein FHS96_000577 [Sphingomonas zeicaulis]
MAVARPAAGGAAEIRSDYVCKINDVRLVTGHLHSLATLLCLCATL